MFLSTFLLTLLIVVMVIIGFRYLGVPTYRLQKRNIIHLLELLLNERASESDWDVFCAFPIHSDPDLEKIRQQCMALAVQEMQVLANQVIFSEQGKNELAKILAKLKKETQDE